MALAPDQLDDLVELTLQRYKRGSWVDISLPNQFYTFADRFMAGNKKTPVKGGTQQSWKLQVSNTGTARDIGLFSQDQTNVKNLTAGATQRWAITTVNFSYDVNEQEFQGDNLTEIVDEIRVREHSMYNDWFEHMEAKLWTAPSSSTQDPRPISGIPFWLQKNATEGFNGGDPSGFSAGAGDVATGTYPKWKNYTFAYTNTTRDDLVAKWIRACEFCNFRAPHSFSELGGGKPNWEFYTTFRRLEPLHQYLDARNDNLKDIAGMASATFKGIPVNWVPELENSDAAGYDTSDPIYGINWNTFEFFFQRGKEMVRHPPKAAANQHNVREVHMDSICNVLCLNRRANFVGYIA